MSTNNFCSCYLKGREILPQTYVPVTGPNRRLQRTSTLHNERKRRLRLQQFCMSTSQCMFYKKGIK